MERTVVSRYIRISPKKLNMVVAAVKNKNAEEILAMIKLTPRKGTKFIFDAIKSCLVQFDKEVQKEVIIKAIVVNKGPVFKRWRPGGRGMAHKYVHRTSHLSVTLGAETKKNGK
ncbi:MAG: uL22 family ribosomal protein [Patescibacteria group bacterium]|jgi:large subunit ribosomal protein L22